MNKFNFYSPDPVRELHKRKQKKTGTKRKIEVRERNQLKYGVKRERGVKFEDLKSTSGKFDANSGFRFQAKLVARKSRKKIGFADTRVADQYYFEQVIVFFFRFPRHCSLLLFSLH